jgi:hypothetical protein
MWRCMYCGNENGMPYTDRNLKGMLCLEPNCGRFQSMTDEESRLEETHQYESDF